MRFYGIPAAAKGPMAGVLFPAAQAGAVILPVMLFHQIQLIACAIIGRRYAAQADATGDQQLSQTSPA